MQFVDIIKIQNKTKEKSGGFNMNKKMQTHKILSALLAVLFIFTALPFAAAADSTEFVSENILRKDGAINSSESMECMYSSLQNLNAVSSSRFTSRDVFGKLIDGEFSYDSGEPDIISNSETDFRLFGVVYALNDVYYSDHLTVYGGTESLVDYYRVYTSDSLDNLFHNENLNIIKADGSADGTVLSLNRDVKYVAFLYDHLTTYRRTDRTDANNGRPKEIELWSGDESKRFVPKSLLTDETALSEAKSIAVRASDNTVIDYTANSGKVSYVINGKDTYTHTDINIWNDGNVGFQFKFDSLYYIGEVVVDAGTYWSESTNYNEKYDIYVSDTLDTLYSESSRVAADVECNDAAGARVAVNKFARYAAVVNTYHPDGIRIRQILVKTASDEDIEKPFVSENALQTKLEKAEAVVRYQSNNNIVYENVITEEKLAAMTDGNTVSHINLSGTLSWPPARYIGAQFTLAEPQFIGNILLYAGYVKYPEEYSIYASDNLETLYSDTNRRVYSALATEESVVTAEVNSTVKYIAFICESYSGNPRFKEIEAWTAEQKDSFVSENVLQTKLSEKTTVDIMKNTGNVVDGTRFNVKGALDISVDGDTTTTAEVYDCIDGWEYPRYPGARYTLTENTYIDRLTLYASGTFIVYASDALDTLYASYNCISDGTAAVLSGTELKISKAVKYLAVFCISSANVAEFQLWSGEKKDDTPDTNALKVLTIGNSYSENTSIYASEIAAANSKALTFGYLKFPSCTIEKHAQAAADDLAVYKFQIVSPDGTRTTLKTEASSFDSPNAESSATIKEALQYMDWDVVVLQQESFASRTASSFDKLGEIIEYVKGYLPNARLAIHEVWRWGEWTADDFADIQANTRAAAAEYKLEYIPTGTAFENARKALGSDKAVNENDGHYQHANTYGQYIAGACYTASLFGITIDESTFASHIYVNDNGNVALLTKAVNDAVAARPIFGRAGDFTNDGFVGSDDLTVMRKWLLDGDDTNAAAADINGDDAFDVRDLVHLKKMIANI